MYRNSYQHGLLSIFYSKGSKPLEIWDTHIQDGYITKFLDDEIKSTVLEIGGNNVSTTYMECPKGKRVLGIFMPFMVMIVKNLKKYFSFEVTILDDSGARRRFRASNFQSTTQVLPLSTAMPIGLNDGWNQIQFDLAKFTYKAYQRQFIEVQRVKINANIRLRRVYFTRTLGPDEELPADFKLFFPLASKGSTKTKNVCHLLEDQPVRPSIVKREADNSKVRLSQSKEKKPDENLTQLSKTSKENLSKTNIPKTPSNLKEEIAEVPKEDLKEVTQQAKGEVRKEDASNLGNEPSGLYQMSEEDGSITNDPSEGKEEGGSQSEIIGGENTENVTDVTTTNLESEQGMSPNESASNTPEKTEEK